MVFFVTSWVVALTASAQRSATFQSLATFVAQTGGLVADALSDGVDVDTGVRGLFVTEVVAKGDPLLVLPPGSYIGASNDEDDHHDDGMHGGELGSLRVFERLIVRLLEACRNKTQSQLRPYLDSLPTSVPLLRDWSAEELRSLQSASLEASAVSQQEHCERTFRRLETLLAEWYSDAEERRHAFDWAESIVRSRALDVSDDASGVRRMVLLPVFDLCNHRSRSRIYGAPDRGDPTGGADVGNEPPSLVVTNDGGVVMLAGHELSAGEELTIEYHSVGGNAALLRDYGFAELLAPWQPGSEELRLSAPCDGRAALPSAIKLEEATPADVEGAVVGGDIADGACTEQGLTEQGVDIHLGTDGSELQALSKIHMLLQSRAAADVGGADEEEEVVEVGVCAALLVCVEATLKDYPSTEHDDREALARVQSGQTRDPTGRLRAALHFRLGQKRQLARTATALRDILPRLTTSRQRDMTVDGEHMSSSDHAVMEALRAARGCQ